MSYEIACLLGIFILAPILTALVRMLITARRELQREIAQAPEQATEAVFFPRPIPMHYHVPARELQCSEVPFGKRNRVPTGSYKNLRNQINKQKIRSIETSVELTSTKDVTSTRAFWKRPHIVRALRT